MTRRDDAWRPLAATYYRHHWICEHCIAAGKNPDLRRCAVGAPLWQRYLDAVAQEKRHDR